MACLLSSLLILIVGSIAAVSFRGSAKIASRLGVVSSITGAILSILPAADVLWTGQSLVLRLPWHVPFGSFYILVDPLAAIFIVIISVISLLSAIYGVGYLKSYEGRKNLGLAWFFFNLLIASMLLVVMARNGVLFIMAWEGMTLSSFFLVMFDHEKPEVRESGWTYLTAAHLGTACLLVLFVLFSGTHTNLDFDRLATPYGQHMPGLLFVLAVLGFGVKAGFFPLHVWLPDAHPAAPSHVSALMSGVMIKTGIYGLIRMISLLGPPPSWWGWTLLIIGAVSGIMGVLYALAQHDLKRLLAYSSVENIGIICLGLGLWLLGNTANNPGLAALGIFGALLHVCNHSIFKSLLFMGAGAVKQGTHTLEIDQLGGLQKRMPHTALTFLIGAAAICGLPLFNGFVSELFLYLGSLGAVTLTPTNGNIAIAGMMTLLALSVIGALAAACFAKVYGIIFLGLPRSDHALSAQKPPFSMKFPMTMLAGLCVLLGLCAPLGVALVYPAAVQLLGESTAKGAFVSFQPWLISLSLGGSLIVAVIAILAGLRLRLFKNRNISEGPTWDCGYIAPSARMQYTASSFAWPIINMFRWILRPQLVVHIDKGDFPQHALIASRTTDLCRQYLFTPIFQAVAILSRSLRWMQQGRNQLYILYIAVTVLVLLLFKLR